MKLALAVISLLFVVVLATTVSAEPGQYIPKGFYTIDENGNESPMAVLSKIHSERLLRRLKRSPQSTFVSSSSSSSSVSSGLNDRFGAPTYFQQTSSTLHNPGYGKPQGTYQQTAGVVDRFGQVHVTDNRYGTV